MTEKIPVKLASVDSNRRRHFSRIYLRQIFSNRRTRIAIATVNSKTLPSKRRRGSCWNCIFWMSNRKRQNEERLRLRDLLLRCNDPSVSLAHRWTSSSNKQIKEFPIGRGKRSLVDRGLLQHIWHNTVIQISIIELMWIIFPETPRSRFTTSTTSKSVSKVQRGFRAISIIWRSSLLQRLWEDRLSHQTLTIRLIRQCATALLKV